MGSMQGKVAVVTGGGNGIGRTISTAFAKEGARVAIVDIDESAAAVAAEQESFGAQALPVRCDISNADVRSAVEATADWFGTVVILVNTVQAATHDVALEDMTDADFDRALAGPTATFRFMRACHPYLVDGGHVINVRSGAEVVVVPDSATREWDWYGITVSCLSAFVLNEQPTEIGRIVVSLADPEPSFVSSRAMTADSAGVLVA